jgi:uncharacterized membrane protein
MIGGYMMDGYATVHRMGWTGLTIVGLLWIVAIVLLAWGLVELLRAQQQRLQPAAMEIQRRRFARRDQPPYVRERRRQ